MSSLTVTRYHNVELNKYIKEIEEQSEKTGFKSAIAIGYKELEVQHGKCRSRALAISSVVFSGWCIFSSVLSAYGAGKAYDEFLEEGGFSDGGGSIGGHTAEWWPRIAGSILTSASWIYLLYNKGKFQSIARECERKIHDISRKVPEEVEDGIVDFSVEATERYRVNFPFFKDEKFIPLQPQIEVDIQLEERELEED